LGNFDKMKYPVISIVIASILFFLTGCGSKKNSCGCPYQSNIQREILSPEDLKINTLLTVVNDNWEAVHVYPEKILEKILSFNFSDERQKIFSGALISQAYKYQGVRYRRGGLSKKGMDCSGLVFKCFSDFGISLPRTSIAMAESVMDVSDKEAKAGDLIFFKTNRRHNTINHVGIITGINGEEIKFIHASIKSGVIESSTVEPYYADRYAKIGRVQGI